MNSPGCGIFSKPKSLPGATANEASKFAQVINIIKKLAPVTAQATEAQKTPDVSSTSGATPPQAQGDLSNQSNPAPQTPEVSQSVPSADNTTSPITVDELAKAAGFDVATDTWGNTATSTRTVIVEGATSSSSIQ